jgi:hypothetical protein
MLDAEVPRSRLEVDQLLAAGQRSRRRWRAAAVAGSVAAVVAVAAAAVGFWPDPSGPRPDPVEFAAETAVTHRNVVVVYGTPCAATPFRTATGVTGVTGVTGAIVDADAAGDRAVGPGSVATGVTLWTRGQPAEFTVPDAPGPVRAVAVNSLGMVVGTGNTGPESYAEPFNWIYRSGAVRRLPTPAGYTSSAVRELNEAGDALGVLGAREGLVVWPATNPDNPRVIAEAGLAPVAIRGDGVVIAISVREPAIVVFEPDGSRRAVPVPAGIGRLDPDNWAFVRGDLFFGSALAGPALRPVRWNLRTGAAEVFENLLGSVTAGTGGGWLTTAFDDRTVAIGPDGNARRLADPGSVVWISAGGTVMIANTPTGPVTWRC